MKFILEHTITETFLKRVKSTPEQVAFRYKPQGPMGPGKWMDVSFAQFYGECQEFSRGLMALDVQRGDRIALFSNTRYEWSLSDMAILGAGAVTVPIYASSTSEDACYILKHSEAKVLIVENARNLLRLFETEGMETPESSAVKSIILLDPPGKSEAKQLEKCPNFQFLNFNEVKERGHENTKIPPSRFVDHLGKAKRGDVLTICYTSGTTGIPKGVVLTHQNLMSVISDCVKVLGKHINPKKEVILSFLPFSHILGKVESMTIYAVGWQQVFAEGPDRLLSNLQEIKPTILFAVPRTFEKAYQLIRSSVRDSSFVTRELFRWAYDIGTEYAAVTEQEGKPTKTLLLSYLLAKSLVFGKVAQRFGGRLRFSICGGAPLPKELGEFFRNAGFLILEGYGLTETCAPVTLNTPERVRFGSVGRPLPDVTIKIEKDGEILLRSAKVFREYYKMPEETAEALQNGQHKWFHTGDIGSIDEDGYLHITDRKKDLIVTSAGKNIAPQKIENLVKTHTLINQFVVLGDRRNYLTALVTLEREQIIRYANEHHILFSEYSELVKNPRIVTRIQRIVDAINKRLAGYETIKKFAILPNEFTIQSGELSPSLKLRRRFIHDKYSSVLDSLYRENSPGGTHATRYTQ